MSNCFQLCTCWRTRSSYKSDFQFRHIHHKWISRNFSMSVRNDISWSCRRIESSCQVQFQVADISLENENWRQIFDLEFVILKPYAAFPQRSCFQQQRLIRKLQLCKLTASWLSIVSDERLRINWMKSRQMFGINLKCFALMNEKS